MAKKLLEIFRRVSAGIGTRFIIILIGFAAVSLLAGTIWLVILIKSQTSAPQTTQKIETTQKGDCASCHAEIQASWHKGAHGDSKSKIDLGQGSNCLACHKNASEINANVNGAKPSFADFWVNEGMPNDCLSCHVTGYDKVTHTWKSEGISCVACHKVTPNNHPDALVSVDKSEENCRTCHTDDRFDWSKWKESVHYQNSMTCVDCHNPHTTSLKIVGQPAGVSSNLCESCHKDLFQSAEHSTHSKIGVTCVDCHFGAPKGNDDFHQIRDHDFKPKIETCNNCHKNQMHATGKSIIAGDLRAFTSANAMARSNATTPVETRIELFPKPVGFIGVAVLFGIIGGASIRKSVFRRKR